jgi:hypothetical protein
VLLLQARKYLIAHSTGTITTPRAMMGRQKKQGNQFPHSKKLLQEPEGNEENRYSDPDSNKMKVNYTKEPNEAHKNNLKEEILQAINENFIEMILDMVNQSIQETLKKFNSRILYPAKPSFKIDGTIKVFHDKQKIKQYVTTKPPLQKILHGILHAKSETQHNHERAGSIKLQEKKKQQSRE